MAPSTVKYFSSALDGMELADGSIKGVTKHKMAVTEALCNYANNLHGGAIASIIDEASTYALLAVSQKPGVSVDLSVSYASAAPLGSQIVITSKVVKVGKTLAFLESYITLEGDESKVIAFGKHTKFIGDSPSPKL